MNGRVAALVDAAGALRAFDGANHLRGQAAAAAIESAREIVCIDVEALGTHLRARGPAPRTAIVDVAAVLRREGLDDSEDGLITRSGYPARDPEERVGSLLRASLKVAEWWERAPGVERSVLDDTTQRNLRGLRIDRVRARELADLYRGERERARAEISAVWPALDARVVRSDVMFRGAIVDRFGVELESLALGSAQGLVGTLVDARRGLLEFDKAATMMTALASGDDVARHFFRYWGAHTGRFTTSGFPLHSLPKHPKAGLELLVREREVVLADEGSWFVARDLHALEARVLAFLADERDLVDRFARNDDVYSWFAALVWPGQPISKTGPLSHLRAIGKVAVLSLGFGAGFPAFAEQVMEGRPATSIDDLEAAYEGFHRKFTRIFAEHRRAQDVLSIVCDGFSPGRLEVCGARLESGKEHLKLRLPSGGAIIYGGLARTVDDRGRKSLWYAPRWCGGGGPPTAVQIRDASVREMLFPDGVTRVRLMPHMLVHNVVQAVARDVVAHMQTRLVADLGVQVAFTVHDEIVGLSRDEPGDWRSTQEVMEVVMGEAPPSLPARLHSLPLASEADPVPRARYGRD